MTFYDIAMNVILGGAILVGYWKGLAWQIASVAAIIVSYIVAVNFREPVSQLIQTQEPWNRVIAMLILFIGTSLIIWTIYARVSKSLKKMELKGFDHQAGAILGAVKGALICMIVTMFLFRNSGRAATCAAAQRLAPLLMPPMMPSRRASCRAYSKASSSSTAITSSTILVSRFLGTNPAPMP